MRHLDPLEFDLEAIQRELDMRAHRPAVDIPPGLAKWLAEMHQDTWFWAFSMHGVFGHDKLTKTAKGTRPGSPMADIGFSMLAAEIIHAIMNRLQDDMLYQQGVDALQYATPPVVWVDDIALPLVAHHASALPELLQKTIAIVHETFQSFAMTVNFAAKKTEAVVAFRGPQSEAMRARYLTSSSLPVLVTSTETHIISLRLTSTYKHLGTVANMEGDLSDEIQFRIATSRQTFQEVAKPVMLNKSLPHGVRLRLLHSLVLSRMFYGAVTWADLTPTQVKRLDHVLTSFQRRILGTGFWSSEMDDDRTFRAKFALPSFRILWMKHRLSFLVHASTDAPAFYRDMLWLEYQTGHGWLREVQDDLSWVHALTPLQWIPTSDEWTWPEVWARIPDLATMKKQVQFAIDKYLDQEKVAVETSALLQDIYTDMRSWGHEWTDGRQAEDTDLHIAFPCDLCPQSFATKQLLATHKFYHHDQASDARAFVQGTVCPGCMKEHWTTRRLQQHIRLNRSRCLDRLRGAREPDEPVTITLSDSMKSIKNLPAVRMHAGPIRPLPFQRKRSRLLMQLAQVMQQGNVSQAWDDLQPCQQGAALMAQFDQIAHAFAAQDDYSATDFQGEVLYVMETSGLSTAVAERWFSEWAEQTNAIGSPHVQSLCKDLDICSVRLQRFQIQKELDDTIDDYQRPPAQPSGRTQHRERRHPLRLPFDDLTKDELKRHAWTCKSIPLGWQDELHGRNLILHVYAGRRRHGDFQMWCEHYLEHRLRHFAIVSLDTAIDASMNITCPKVWNWLIQAATQGRIAIMLLGPPCESWSSARHEKLFNHRGEEIAAPRPIRSAASPWGLMTNTCRENAQGGVGTPCDITGRQLHQPRKHILQIENVFHLTTIWQYQFGSVGCKPTTFLYCGFDLDAGLTTLARTDTVRPTRALIGKEGDRFATFRAKEYPARLNAALALCTTHSIPIPDQCKDDKDWNRLAEEFKSASLWSTTTEILADYQA
eukprot:Skav225866  [mRNA]  locus=scaffold810:294773:297819:+ [translate_table: standard]